ncbi:DUF1015 family protein [Amycolatopsis sp. H20-H5]|uniref:DUF1015 family protein n=1 Tax=Amycolatopsis sp. H20-H5 TaxID=3046309 RepID=UPI002DBA2E32|nr:DUF1015 family protein [Amycolatopsis sp. H20-H5]MEC3976070.1 DUF1015 family protein [Amycolatopsis sp. H20-H5]
MSAWLRPIRTGWVVRDEVPGPDVDEFDEPERVITALAAPGAADDTLLAVQHPHRTPAARTAGLDVRTALPLARVALDRLRALHYRRVSEVVAPYRIDGPDGSALGVLCLVDPAAVGADGASWVRHTEEVYPEVVAERAAVLSGLGCATSAAMLIPASGGAELTGLVEDVCAGLGAPTSSTVDSGGRRHALWLLGPGQPQDELLAALRQRPLLVADGNHRVAAATAQRSLLALVTGGPGLRIGPIHRVLRGTGLGPAELEERWRSAGLDVRRGGAAQPPAAPGEVVVVAGEAVLTVRLPAWQPGPSIDHGVVERVLVQQALGVDPDGPSLRPLFAGRTPPADADAVLLLAPVPLADLLAIHAAGRRMPRKATYFTPKPRSGLLLADL